MNSNSGEETDDHQMQHGSLGDRKDTVKEVIKQQYEKLSLRGLPPNEAAALALKIVSGKVSSPPSLPEVFSVIDEAHRSKSNAAVLHMLQNVMMHPDVLSVVFLSKPDTCTKSNRAGIDVASVQQFYDRILALSGEDAVQALMACTASLLSSLTASLSPSSSRMHPTSSSAPQLLPEQTPHSAAARCLLVVLDNWMLMEPEHHLIYGKLCSLLLALPPMQREEVVCTLSGFSADHLERLVETAQHVITIQLHETGMISKAVQLAVKAMGLLYAANERSSAPLRHRVFYNDAINGADFVDLEREFVVWREGSHIPNAFSLCNHAYVFDAGSKSRLLQLESRGEKTHHFHEALFTGLFSTGILAPFCVLEVRREHIVEDAIAQIQRSPEDLKKPLKIQFVGEEGVDEGGVSKEFFQLIVKETLDAKFGMFAYSEETRLFWFTPTDIDMAMEFDLIGVVLGLAMYNSHILDVHFPPVLFKKLLGKPTVFEDLEGVDPGLYNGLKGLLKFNGDIEETYQWSFEASYMDAFGSVHTVPLKDGGGDIPVTKDNRQEYVDLLVDFHLNKLVAPQFDAFLRGFSRLSSGHVMRLFDHEELELVVCGSPVLDFDELEKGARYENGYSSESPIIKHFWTIVHGLTEVEKRNLLSFVTGSDRVPVKGLGSLPFVIARNGPDSDRLPTAHTCYNHLLLPDYASIEKLHKHLLTAISNSQGFGLI